MKPVINVSRRQFLGGLVSTGAFVLAARVLPDSAWAQTPVGGFKTKADTAPLHPSVYLGIEPDGTVFIVTHRSEMGTGIRTSLPLVAADELDAEIDARVEPGGVGFGLEATDGRLGPRGIGQHAGGQHEGAGRHQAAEELTPTDVDDRFHARLPAAVLMAARMR